MFVDSSIPTGTSSKATLGKISNKDSIDFFILINSLFKVSICNEASLDLLNWLLSLDWEIIFFSCSNFLSFELNHDFFYLSLIKIVYQS